MTEWTSLCSQRGVAKSRCICRYIIQTVTRRCAGKPQEKLGDISTFLGLWRSHLSFSCSGTELCSASQADRFLLMSAQCIYSLSISLTHTHTLTLTYTDTYRCPPVYSHVLRTNADCAGFRVHQDSIGAITTCEVNIIKSSLAWKIDFVMYTLIKVQINRKEESAQTRQKHHSRNCSYIQISSCDV